MIKHIARYLRLSRDDDDKNDESNSISSQRSIIMNFISSVDELYNTPVSEFVDDGYSGTNFDRPGIKKLLEAVRRGEIHCVVVKDLSRFGRAYLDVCKYIEVIFPYLGVRFISVNDHYDSNNHKGTTAEVDVAFRNLMNALYSKDISKKVKSAKLTKIYQGKNINAFAPFGYKKCLGDKHKLIIDEPAATVVKRVFEMYSSGHTPIEIANVFNSEGILTPSEYKKKNGSKHNITGITGKIWTNGCVNNILHNEQYLGILVCGRRATDRVGGNNNLHQPKEKWIRIQNAHPAIISTEIWDKVYLLKSKYSCTKRSNPNINRFLFKKIRCGYCGHVLCRRATKKKIKGVIYTYYYCGTPRFTEEYGCTNIRYISIMVEEIVKAVVKQQIDLMLNKEKICREVKERLNEISESDKKNTRLLDNDIDRINASKQQLYESYLVGNINMNEYIKQREEAEAVLLDKKKAREERISGMAKKSDEIDNAHRFFSAYTKYQNEAEPSAEVVDSLIENVYVFSMDRIEVKFKFRDEFELMEKKLMDIIVENN